jgi:hypothetical protein
MIPFKAFTDKSIKDKPTELHGNVGKGYGARIQDSSGVSVWGDLNINAREGVMTVTIPQEFLDKATYPIHHAAGATFGYTTAGSSGSTGVNVNQLICVEPYTCTEAGTVSKITASMTSSTKTAQTKLGIYTNDATMSLVAQDTVGITAPTSKNWADSGAISGAVTARDYFLCHCDNTNAVSIYYDSGASGYAFRYKAQTYANAWPSTITKSSLTTDAGKANWKFSIYATYTPDEGSTAIRDMMGIGFIPFPR